jgi:hypothetical protein
MHVVVDGTGCHSNRCSMHLSCKAHEVLPCCGYTVTAHRVRLMLHGISAAEVTETLMLLCRTAAGSCSAATAHRQFNLLCAFVEPSPDCGMRVKFCRCLGA